MRYEKEETIETVRNRLCDVSSSLKGLSSLFTRGTRDFCFEDDEFFGLGQLLKGLSNELFCLADTLNRDYDNHTKAELKRNNPTYESDG